jgi:hypothetical protein
MPVKIRSHLENVVRPIKNFGSSNLARKTAEIIDKTRLQSEADALKETTTYLRHIFLKVHKKVGVNVLIGDGTSEEILILIEPNTLLRTTWDYVNQFPLKGLYVDDRPYYELPLTEPRIIPHPNNDKRERGTPPHGDCLNLDLLKYLFPS